MKLSNYIKDVLLNVVAYSIITPKIIRHIIYRYYGYIIKKNAIIHPMCFCGYGKGRITIGENSYCNYQCFFDLGDDIIIGDNCAIGMRVTFINSSHISGSSKRRAGENTSISKIIIKEGCWIGANVTIMPGITINKGCVIGAGSLVTKDCEENSLYYGVPAVRIKSLS